MYRQVVTDSFASTLGGGKFKPVATLADEFGGRCQIAIDDHCYVLWLQRPDGSYSLTNHIFREAFNVLIMLPEPE